MCRSATTRSGRSSSTLTSTSRPGARSPSSGRPGPARRRS
jgi:hypothetical protein